MARTPFLADVAITWLAARGRRPVRPAGAAALGVGAALAGGALVWLLDRQGGQGATPPGGALHAATERVRAAALGVRERAARTAHQARERASRRSEAVAARARELSGKALERAGAMTERAKELSGEAQTRLSEVRSRLAEDGRAAPRQGAFGALLVGRAILGRGLLRAPSGILGASVLARAAQQSEPVRRGARRATAVVRQATASLRQAREARDAGARAEPAAGGAGEPAGGTTPEETAARLSGSARVLTRTPEVHEVKSPTELEPGIASARPDSPLPGRVDRSGPHMAERGGGATRRSSTAIGDAEAVLSAPTTDDVAQRAGFQAPEAGAGVRDEDLGVVIPHEGAGEEGGSGPVLGLDAEPLSRAAAGAELSGAPRAAGPEGEGGPARMAGASDATDVPAAAEAAGEEREPAPTIADAADEGAPPRIAGAGDEPAAERKTAGERDAARTDPTSDGG